MKLIVEFFLILTVGITPLIFTSLLYGKYREAYNRLTNPEKLIGSLFSAMAPIAAVLFIVLNRPEGVASIGLLNNTNGRNGNAILVGIIAISIAILIVSLVTRIRRKNKPAGQAPPDVNQPGIEMVARYQRTWERLGYLVETVIAVISEDILFRGYLVLFMGSRTHTYIPWILLSIGLSILIHLYQGRTWKIVLFHAVAAAFFITLTLITKNLLATISAHLYYDLIVTVGTWRQIDRWNPQRARPTTNPGEGSQPDTDQTGTSTPAIETRKKETNAAARKRNKAWPIISIAAAVLIICLVGSCGILKALMPILNNLRTYNLTIGSPAPDFTLASLDGELVRLSDFAGQPVLLSFGATWCPHCNANDPLLQQAYEDHPDLAVLLVDGGETRETVLEWLKGKGYTFPILLDSFDLVDRRYRVSSIPIIYFIDANQVIQLIVYGEITPVALEYNLPLIGIEP